MSSLNEILYPEIFDTIFANLQDDLKSLGVCGLVCSSWMLRTRHRLQFHTVHLNIHNIAGFVKLFRDHSSTPSTIIPFIHNFRYTCVANPEDMFPRFYLPAQASRPALRISNSFNEILHRLPPLPVVASVMLQGITLDSFDGDYQVYLGTIFPNIVDLELRGVAYGEGTYEEHCMPSGVLQSVTFEQQSTGEGLREFHQFMLRQPNPHLIQRLSVFSLLHCDLEAFLESIKDIGHELTELTIWEDSTVVKYHRSSDDLHLADIFSRPKSYERLDKLESLRISSQWIGRLGKSWALSLLSGLQRPLNSLQLRTRHIRDPHSTYTKIEDLCGWDQLFQVLCQRQFSELRELQFIIKGAETLLDVEVKDMIRRKFEEETSLTSHCVLSFGQDDEAL